MCVSKSFLRSRTKKLGIIYYTAVSQTDNHWTITFSSAENISTIRMKNHFFMKTESLKYPSQLFYSGITYFDIVETKTLTKKKTIPHTWKGIKHVSKIQNERNLFTVCILYLYFSSFRETMISFIINKTQTRWRIKNSNRRRRSY